MTKKTLALLVLGCAAFSVLGCDSNPTNVPAKAEVDNADKARLAAIDNDPSLNAEQKAMMKSRISAGQKQNASRPQ